MQIQSLRDIYRSAGLHPCRGARLNAHPVRSEPPRFCGRPLNSSFKLRFCLISRFVGIGPPLRCAWCSRAAAAGALCLPICRVSHSTWSLDVHCPSRWTTSVLNRPMIVSAGAFCAFKWSPGLFDPLRGPSGMLSYHRCCRLRDPVRRGPTPGWIVCAYGLPIPVHPRQIAHPVSSMLSSRRHGSRRYQWAIVGVTCPSSEFLEPMAA